MSHNSERIQRAAVYSIIKVGFIATDLADRLAQIKVEFSPTYIGLQLDDLLGEAVYFMRLEIRIWKGKKCFAIRSMLNAFRGA
jgi:hypothetical protein